MRKFLSLSIFILLFSAPDSGAATATGQIGVSVTVLPPHASDVKIWRSDSQDTPVSSQNSATMGASSKNKPIVALQKGSNEPAELSREDPD